MVKTDWRSSFRAPIIFRCLAAGVFWVAALALCLRIIDSEFAQAAFPEFESGSALALMLTSAASLLILQRQRWAYRLGQGFAIAVLVASLCALLAYLLQVNTGFSQLPIFTALANQTRWFAANTAETMVYIALALLLPTFGIHQPKLAHFLIILACTIAGIAFLGHLYGVEEFFRAFDFIPMSLSESILLLIVALVVLYPTKDEGLFRIVTAPTAGGIMIRHVLPFVILVPHEFGLIFLIATRLFQFSIASGMLLVIIIIETVLIGVIWWNAQIIDRTEQERSVLEHHLRESEARYRALFEHSNDVILIVDDNAHYLDANPQAETLTGYTRAELLAMSVPDLTAPVIPNGRELFDQFKKVGSMSGEYILKRKDGRQVPIEYNASRIAAGVYQSVIHDITERKRVETNLRRSLEKEREVNELRSRFVSLVSHEFRTPLTIIRTYSDILLKYDNRLTYEQRMERLEKIQTQITHMTALLEDVLTLEKAESNHMRYEPELIDFVVFCRQIITEFSPTATDHKIAFTSSDTHVPALIDEQLMRLAITNLLSNAAKYSPDQPLINVDVAADNDQILVLIQDFGIGIPFEDRERLFRFFQRASNVGTISGTGLGLSIVKQAVETHGGTISFSSDAGTTFVIRIPRFKQPTLTTSPALSALQ